MPVGKKPQPDPEYDIVRAEDGGLAVRVRRPGKKAPQKEDVVPPAKVTPAKKVVEPEAEAE